MEFILDLQNLNLPETAGADGAAAGGLHLQSDLGSYSCYGCSWAVDCIEG